MVSRTGGLERDLWGEWESAKVKEIGEVLGVGLDWFIVDLGEWLRLRLVCLWIREV